LLAISTLPVPAKAETALTQTEYFNYDQILLDIGDIFGGGSYNLYYALIPYYNYNLGGTAYSEISYSSPSGRSYQWGIRVFEVAWNDTDISDMVEITSGSPVAIVERATNGEGIQTASWNCIGYNFTLPMPHLVVAEYCRTKATSVWGAWYLGVVNGYSAYFVNEGVWYPKLANSTWAVSYYTYRATGSGSWTYGRFYFGDDGMGTTYESKIENMQFDNGVSAVTESEFPVGLGAGAILMGLIAVIAFSVGKKRH